MQALPALPIKPIPKVSDMGTHLCPYQGSKDQPAVSSSELLGMSGNFVQLKIGGLDKITGSHTLSARNKELIFRFLNHIAPEVSERRLTFYTHKLRKLAGWLNKDFDTVTEADLRLLLTYLTKGVPSDKGGPYASGTVHGYKVTLKRFYRWLEGGDEEYPHKVRWIKTSDDEARIKAPEQLLSSEEVLKMIHNAGNPRDKAMVSFLYESGTRVSEMLSMRMKHLEFLPGIVKATLPVSKTVPRVIPLVSCLRHLATWVNYHPRKDEPDAPLWSNLKRYGGDSLKPQTVSEILKSIAVKAGINKRIYPHLFRACSITHKQAAGWPEQAIKMFHGLSKDSKVMKHYSHLSYNNLEHIQRQMNGLPAADTQELNRGVRCQSCGKTNPLCVEICECGLPTEISAVSRTPDMAESGLEARLEKKLEEFIEKRFTYDRLMEQFLKKMLEKSKLSPALSEAIREVSADLNNHPDFSSPSSCPD